MSLLRPPPFKSSKTIFLSRLRPRLATCVLSQSCPRASRCQPPVTYSCEILSGLPYTAWRFKRTQTLAARLSIKNPAVPPDLPQRPWYVSNTRPPAQELAIYPTHNTLESQTRRNFPVRLTIISPALPALAPALPRRPQFSCFLLIFGAPVFSRHPRTSLSIRFIFGCACPPPALSE
jgi:hypothetical protein